MPRDLIPAVTDRQRIALEYRRRGYDDEAGAKAMGITRENFNRLVNRALRADRFLVATGAFASPIMAAENVARVISLKPRARRLRIPQSPDVPALQSA